MSQPGPSVCFDRAAGCYDATRGFPAGVAKRVAELFAHVGSLGPRSRVLEVGIGTGRIALPLAARVGRYTGADLSGPMLRRLLEKRGALPVDLVRADATRLPFADGSFDAAIGVHVFHLIPGWRDVLVELARVLRPDGLLLHGGEDHAQAPAWLRWRSRVDSQRGETNVGVPRARIEGFPEDRGWRPTGVERITFTRRLRPRVLVEQVEGRSWSTTWRLDDAQLAEAAAALRADLTDALGDLDREVEVETGFWVRAYRAASGARALK
jgi:SAM-dependent methyltransferase